MYPFFRRRSAREEQRLDLLLPFLAARALEKRVEPSEGTMGGAQCMGGSSIFVERPPNLAVFLFFVGCPLWVTFFAGKPKGDNQRHFSVAGPYLSTDLHEGLALSSWFFVVVGNQKNTVLTVFILKYSTPTGIWMGSPRHPAV